MGKRLSPLRALREGLDRLSDVARAIKSIEPRCEVYLAGGAAENRLTIASDIDILVVLPSEPSFDEAVKLEERIWSELERIGVPSYIPIEIHVISKESLGRYSRRGKIIRLA